MDKRQQVQVSAVWLGEAAGSTDLQSEGFGVYMQMVSGGTGVVGSTSAAEQDGQAKNRRAMSIGDVLRKKSFEAIKLIALTRERDSI